MRRARKVIRGSSVEGCMVVVECVERSVPRQVAWTLENKRSSAGQFRSHRDERLEEGKSAPQIWKR
jgi:hypothetical protein